ncbi:MAG: hypothetical protein GF308_08670 [Candidatus Heimdallarchaeota archaeon]|nr:hypothetical protein [Candidatus Heimdallarchaeota archaeon]
MYKKGAIDQASAIPLADFSKTQDQQSFILQVKASQDIIQITGEGSFYLNLNAYLKFRREYNQRLFLVISNVVIVSGILLILLIAWLLNYQLFR